MYPSFGPSPSAEPLPWTCDRLSICQDLKFFQGDFLALEVALFGRQSKYHKKGTLINIY